MTPEGALVLYRIAAADLLRACRDLASASSSMEDAARVWERTGGGQDPVVLANAEICLGLLAAAVRRTPGMRDLFLAAVDAASSTQETEDGMAG